MAKPKQLIKLALTSLLKALSVKMEEIKTDAGAVLSAEVFEPGEPVFIMEAETPIPLPVGEYVLETGQTLTVTEEGIIGAIAEAAAAEPDLDKGKDTPIVPADPGEKSYTVNEIKALIDAGLSKEKAENETKVKALETKLAELEAKLAAEPEPEGIKPNPEGRKTEMVKLGKKDLSPVERVFELMTDN